MQDSELRTYSAPPETILLGRLKLAIIREFGGDHQGSSADNAVARGVLELHRSMPGAAEVLMHLLGLTSAYRLDFSSLPDVDLNALTVELERHAWPQPRFIELIECPEPLPSTMGLLAVCEHLEGGGFVYTLTGIGEDEFPSYYLGRAEIRACMASPEPLAAATIDNGAVRVFNAENWREHEFLRWALPALNYCHQRKISSYLPLTKSRQLELKGRIKKPLFSAPEDSELVQRLNQVYKRSLFCYKNEVPLSSLRPHSFEFCMLYPIELVQPLVREIKYGSRPELLVYWTGSEYITSDDYGNYLAYRAAGIERVPVVIIGDFPECVNMQAYGPEALPPVRTREVLNYRVLTQTERDALLDRRLAKGLRNLLDDLLGLLLGFQELLADAKLPERILHDFITSHPTIVDASGARIHSEITFGPYRIDLILETPGVPAGVTLIELERSGLSIFTSKGRLRSHVVHAIQQVEDWLQLWREHPELVPAQFNSRIPPEGVVVIGRALALSEGDKRRIAHLNHTRRVKIMTYDDLALRLEQLYMNLDHRIGGRSSPP